MELLRHLGCRGQIENCSSIVFSARQDSIVHATGETTDITNWPEYDWYQLRPSAVNSFPEDTKSIGRWSVVAHRIGQAICYWILPESGTPAQSLVQPISEEEMQDPVVIAALKAHDTAVYGKLDGKHGKLDGKDDPPENTTQAEPESTLMTTQKTHMTSTAQLRCFY